MMTRHLVCLPVFLCMAEMTLAQDAFSDSPRDMTNAEIERLLDQKRDMVFEDATLEAVATFLETNGIPTLFDRRALDDSGISTDEPVTFRQHGIRLRDGLSFVLDSIDLTWTPRNGRLVISTPEEEEDGRRLITTVYDVRNLVDLVPVSSWGGGYWGGSTQTAYTYDFDPLIDTITRTIASDSWDEVGGPGAIKPYATRRMRVIVVSQTYDVHRRMQALLDELAVLGGTTPLPIAVRNSPPKQRLSTMVKSPARQQPSRPHVEIRSSRLRKTGR